MCAKLMARFKRHKRQVPALTFDELPWIPGELARSLSTITSFLRDTFESEISRIGLYGSWQRGDATLASDVDIVVFLKQEVPWFDAINGYAGPSAARKERYRWHIIELEVNRRRLDSRRYSVSVVTMGMINYYTAFGPNHLQNWAHALMSSYPLWEE